MSTQLNLRTFVAIPLTPTTLKNFWPNLETESNFKESLVIFNPKNRQFEVLNEEDSQETFTHEFFENKKTKILIYLEGPFYYLIYNHLSTILKMYYADPQLIFVFYGTEKLDPEDLKIIDFFKKLFDSLNLQYVFVENLNFNCAIKIKNYVDIKKFIENKNLRITLDDIKIVSDTVAKYINNKQKPYRKVYLSRSHIAPKIFKTDKSNQGYSDDIRLKNQKDLENFFLSKGYEIIIPEKIFSTFEDQINFMSTVKVLASITSAGLLNSIFMKNDQTIVEVSAELVFQNEPLKTTQDISNFYVLFSYIKNHIHISIPSKRNCLEVINKIKTINLD